MEAISTSGRRRAASAAGSTMIDPSILVPAIGDAFRKLDPRLHDPQPGDVRGRGRRDADHGALHPRPGRRARAISASRSRSISGSGSRCCSPISPKRSPKAAARRRRRRLRRTQDRSQSPSCCDDEAPPNGTPVPGDSRCKPGDIVLVEAGDLIPSDGDVIEGVASVDEAAITGESAPVIRESGGDRSAVTGGTQVISDWIKVRITAAQGSTFLDRMIALVEGAERQKTPNEIALNILLAGLTIIFVFAVATIPSFAAYAGGTIIGARAGGAVRDADPDHDRRAAVGHRHRRHGPAGALQRAGHVGPRGRSGGRRRHAAARQDRHDHARQPPGDRVHSA